MGKIGVFLDEFVKGKPFVVAFELDFDKAGVAGVGGDCFGFPFDTIGVDDFHFFPDVRCRRYEARLFVLLTGSL